MHFGLRMLGRCIGCHRQPGMSGNEGPRVDGLAATYVGGETVDRKRCVRLVADSVRFGIRSFGMPTGIPRFSPVFHLAAT